MNILFKFSFYLFLFSFLTITTQIGGIVLILSSILSSKIKKQFSCKNTICFLGLYLFFTLLVVPLLAPLFGREKVKHQANLYPTSFATVLLNRNYVKPRMNDLLQSVAVKLSSKNIELRYLDANFPFIDGFPLLPHLSHDDGKKIDLSFVYTEPGSSVDSRKKKSLSGYGVFEGPKKNELDQIGFCKNKGYWQYDYPKYFTFGSINDELEFSQSLNIEMINSILKENKLDKMFIEPHLKSRLNLNDSKVRFHGCGSVRHDDHIHIQL